MSDEKPIWAAAWLNEFIGRYGGESVGFAPPGSSVSLGASATERLSGELAHRVCRPADSAHRTKDAADLYPQNVTGIVTATTNLGCLPLPVAICSFDPEAWCAVVIHGGALETAGPFRDVASPLREWLLRAANAGQPIGMHRAGWAGPSFDWVRTVERSGIATTSESGITGDFCVLTESTLPALAAAALPDQPAWLAEYLEAFAARQFDCAVKSKPDGIALAAGVWQMNGFLDRSHELAQSVEGQGRNQAGDYWHAILHRREPDYSNAKYWFRRVGQHGISPLLAKDAGDILAACGSTDAPRWRNALIDKGRQTWNALAFVDLCEHVADGHDPELSLAARMIQFIEMALLLVGTYHDAVS